MFFLILGVALWSGVHLIPNLGRPLRVQLVARYDEQRYMGMFALAILTSVGLMIYGWRSSDAVLLYDPGMLGRWAAMGLMLPALVLFAASAVPTNLKRVLRHPQLSGVALWGFAHLLANGESRSILLFGGLAVWALSAMAAINQRDGAWKKPAKRPWHADLVPAVAGIALYAGLYFAHRWIAGVPLPLPAF